MELSQYKQTFAREQVNGSMLAIVNDDILKDELDVHSKLHRVRLLKIVGGSDPIVNSVCAARGKYAK